MLYTIFYLWAVVAAVSGVCPAELTDPNGEWNNGGGTNAGCINEASNACTLTCNNGFESTGVADTVNCIAGDIWDPAVASTCVDVDECLGTPCHPEATCDNTVGSYTCTCNTGYVGDGVTCDSTVMARVKFENGDFELYAAADTAAQDAFKTDLIADFVGHTMFDAASPRITTGDVSVIVMPGSLLVEFFIKSTDPTQAQQLIAVLQGTPRMGVFASASVSYTAGIADTLPTTLAGVVDTTMITTTVDFPEAPKMYDKRMVWWVKRLTQDPATFPSVAFDERLYMSDPDSNFNAADLYDLTITPTHGEITVNGGAKQTTATLTGQTLAQLNAALASLTYTPTHCDINTCPLFLVDSPVEQVATITFDVHDQGQNVDASHVITVNIAAPYYPTCQEAVDAPQHTGACGCFYVPDGVTDAQFAGSKVGYNPMDHPLVLYSRSDTMSVRTFVQGCCGEESALPFNAWTLRGRVGLCYTPAP